MPVGNVFAEIALVVTLCSPGAALPGGQVADNGCEKSQPGTWESSYFFEAVNDWGTCKGQEAAELARPGVVEAKCRYTLLAGLGRSYE